MQPHPDGYLTVHRGGEAEIVEKKSRFIATVRPVETEEEAVAFINETKKRYWDARHNCSAFVLGPRQETNRCSDDGEPAQTAGRPMLDVLLREGITNAAVVVTRYFGGTLLGTGGLIRAYQAATKAGLNASTIIEKRTGAQLVITTDYSGLGKLQFHCSQRGLVVLDTKYEDGVTLTILVPRDSKERVLADVIDLTHGGAACRFDGDLTYAVIDKEVVVLP